MDHDQIEEQQIAERYLLGQLSVEEADQFEAHTLYCAACRDRLDTTEALLQGLRAVAAEDGAAIGRMGALAWLARRGLWARAGLAALLVVGLAMPGWLLWRNLGQVRSDLEALRRPGVASVVSLAALRGASSGEPSHRVVLGDRSGWVVLSLELDEPIAERYRVTLEASDGGTLWGLDDLAPDPRASLAMSIPASSLEPGIYQLRAEALLPSGPAAAGRYTFRAVD